jgi:hypothetical protein
MYLLLWLMFLLLLQTLLIANTLSIDDCIIYQFVASRAVFFFSLDFLASGLKVC